MRVFSSAEDEELLPADDDEVVVVDAEDPYLKTKRLFKKDNGIYYRTAKSIALEYGKVMCDRGWLHHMQYTVACVLTLTSFLKP